MRLFVGIELDEQAGRALDQVQERLAAAGGGLRWSRPGDRHVTLQFLGKADVGQFTCLQAHLAEVREQPCPVRLSGLGFFVRAGVFWAGVERTPGLLELRHKIMAATRICGFTPEMRPYHPHITLARQRGRGFSVELRKLQQGVASGDFQMETEFLASEFLLYDSMPGAIGSRYEVRARLALRRSF